MTSHKKTIFSEQKINLSSPSSTTIQKNQAFSNAFLRSFKSKLQQATPLVSQFSEIFENPMKNSDISSISFVDCNEEIDKKPVFYKSLSPVKNDTTYFKDLQEKEGEKKSIRKLKGSLKKGSDFIDILKKDEFLASKNLLYSSPLNTTKLRSIENELINEKTRFSESQQANDELVFALKTLHSEVERLHLALQEKENNLIEVIQKKEMYKKKLEDSQDNTKLLKEANLRLVEQVNRLMKVKLISKN